MPLKSQTEINDRIIKEIDKLDAEKKIKTFLKDILEVELDIIDIEKAQYVGRYKSIIDSIL